MLAKEILEIADTPCTNQVEVAQQRNRLDTRKWLASKLAPRKYGDRVEHDVKGGLHFQPSVLVIRYVCPPAAWKSKRIVAEA